MIDIDFIKRYFQKMTANQEIEQTSYEHMVLDIDEEIYRFLVSCGIDARFICEPSILKTLTTEINDYLSQTIDGQTVNLRNTIYEENGLVTITFRTTSAENSLTFSSNSITLKRKGILTFGNPQSDNYNSSQEISRYYIENNQVVNREVFSYNAVQESHKPSIVNESYLMVTDHNLSSPTPMSKELSINYISRNTTPKDIENIIDLIYSHQDLNYIADLVIGAIVKSGTSLRDIEFYCQNNRQSKLIWTKKESSE